MKKNIFFSLVTGLLFTALTLYFAFRNIPFSDVTRYLKTLNYFWILPAAFTAIASFILRVFRWRLIMKSIKPVAFSNCYHPLMIGFMLNCVLPGRVGEIARPVIFMKKENLPFTTCLATIVTERLFDLICLISILALVLSVIHIDPALTKVVGKYRLTGAMLSSAGSGLSRLCILVIIGAVLISIRTFRNWLNNVLLKCPSALFFLSESSKTMIRDKAVKRLISLIEHFADGLTLLKEPWRLIGCLLLSLVIWVVQGYSYHLMTFACPGLSMSFPQTMAMMIMVCIFIALPSVPGYWGLWEAGGIFALSLFSVAGDQAAGYTLMNHVVQIVPIIIAGLVSALAIGFDYKDYFKQNQSVV